MQAIPPTRAILRTMAPKDTVLPDPHDTNRPIRNGRLISLRSTLTRLFNPDDERGAALFSLAGTSASFIAMHYIPQAAAGLVIFGEEAVRHTMHGVDWRKFSRTKRPNADKH